MDQQFLAQTFVAVDPDGLDPCDLRQQRGDSGVTELLARRVPLFEFVIRTALNSHDLDTAEGRVAALRAAAPTVASIKDRALRPEYTRRLAGWLGMDTDTISRAVADAGRSQQSSPGEPPPHTGAIQRPQGEGPSRPNPRDPVVRAEAMSLGVLLQAPREAASDPLGGVVLRDLDSSAFTVPQYRAVFDAITAAGGPGNAGADWANQVAEQAGETLAGVVSELAVTPLPHDRPDALGHWAGTVLARVMDLSLTRQIAEVRGRMQRAGEGTENHQTGFADLIALEKRRRSLREP